MELQHLIFPFHDESDDGLLHLINLAYEFSFVCVAIGILTMDFGCGSRDFSLPLVLLFLKHIFVCMDYKLEKHLITKSNTSSKVFVMFNSGDIKMRITFTLGGIYHHQHSWWMGPFNNFTSMYISWVVLKLKNFSFIKNQVLSSPIPIIFFVGDNAK